MSNFVALEFGWFSLFHFCFPTLSRSSGLVSRAHEKYQVSRPFSLASLSNFSRVLLSTIPVSTRICPPVVDFPASVIVFVGIFGEKKGKKDNMDKKDRLTNVTHEEQVDVLLLGSHFNVELGQLVLEVDIGLRRGLFDRRGRLTLASHVERGRRSRGGGSLGLGLLGLLLGLFGRLFSLGHLGCWKVSRLGRRGRLWGLLGGGLCGGRLDWLSSGLGNSCLKSKKKKKEKQKRNKKRTKKRQGVEQPRVLSQRRDKEPTNQRRGRRQRHSRWEQRMMLQRSSSSVVLP